MVCTVSYHLFLYTPWAVLACTLQPKGIQKQDITVEYTLKALGNRTITTVKLLVKVKNE